MIVSIDFKFENHCDATLEFSELFNWEKALTLVFLSL